MSVAFPTQQIPCSSGLHTLWSPTTFSPKYGRQSRPAQHQMTSEN